MKHFIISGTRNLNWMGHLFGLVYKPTVFFAICPGVPTLRWLDFTFDCPPSIAAVDSKLLCMPCTDCTQGMNSLVHFYLVFFAKYTKQVYCCSFY